LDEDSDNDHVPDYIESMDANMDGKADVAFSGTDSDGDGLDDAYDTVVGKGSDGNAIGSVVIPVFEDSDGDKIVDWRDVDDDNDTILTAEEETSSIDGDPTNDDCNFNGIPNYLDPESCEFLMPDAFSPNGDGINDYLRVRGIYRYPDAHFEIYNRWGVKVFEKDHYGNIQLYGDPDAWWDGHANVNGNRNSEILPAGTYLYILILDGSSVNKGTVYINR
jgi:gliding motility-associated-like protein